MEKSRLKHLFELYFKKAATTSERDELMMYIANSKSDEPLEAEMMDLYNLHHKKNDKTDLPVISSQKEADIIRSILSNENSRLGSVGFKTIRAWHLVAASLFVIMCSGLLLWQQHSGTQEFDSVRIAPGGNKAVLTLDNGAQIVLDEATRGEIANSHGVRVLKDADGKLIYEISAASGNVDRNVFHTISTPRGGQYQLKLPDGTQVWLNAASSLRYPVSFADSHREVELNGEGYFEVAKNPAAPFKVITPHQDITVLGTHFNVNAYQDELQVLTTVLEGSVRVNPKNQIRNGVRQFEVLKVNQQSVLNLNSNKIKVSEVDAMVSVAWKMGKFQFQGTHISEVMRQWSRWYDVDFKYQGKLPDIRLSGEVNRNVDAAEALDILNFFDLKYLLERQPNGKKVIIVK